MNIAITGGTGFVGAHLARQLVARGHFPRLLARGLNLRDETIRRLPNAAFTPLALTDDRKLFQSFQGCDLVAHLAGIWHEATPGDFYKVHVESTIHVIHAARKAGVKKIVYMSYLKARPRCFSAWHESKYEAEELIRNSELDYTILKPALMYGRNDHLLTTIARLLEITPSTGTVGLLEKTQRVVAVEDVVEILLASLLQNRLSRMTVPVMGPEELKVSGMIRKVSNVLKKPIVILPLPALFQLYLASNVEKSSRDPLVPVVQVRMLAEGMDKVQPPCDDMPPDLQPKTFFNEEQIIRGLG
ncbi:MAG TPA: NAD(P)H-binding protein [Candidatus Obscuribacterales bacterium]